MAFPRQKIVTLVLVTALCLLLWKCWGLKVSVVETGFITFQAEAARETVRAGATPEAVVHTLDFFMVCCRSHIRKVGEPMLIQIIERKE